MSVWSVQERKLGVLVLAESNLEQQMVGFGVEFEECASSRGAERGCHTSDIDQR